MKRFFLLSALLFSFMLIFAQTNFEATYNLAGSPNDVVSLTYNGDVYSGISPSPLVKVGITSSGSNGNFRANNWPLGATNGSDDFTGSIDLDMYIGFSIEPVAGYTFTITSIKFGLGRSATGARQFEWRGSSDGFTNALNDYSSLNTSLVNNSGVLTCPDANSSWTNNILTLGTTYSELTTSAEFRLYGYNAEATTGTSGLQGDITIQGYFSSNSEIGLSILSPTNNQIVNSSEIEVVFSTSNFDLGTDGKLEYKLNSGTPQYVVSSPFTITDLIEGNNNIDFQLVDMSENPLSPSVAISRTVIYEVPNTNPTLTITSPTQGATIYSQDLSIAFSLSNFVLGVDGKLSYKLDGAAKIMYLGTSPINLTGLSLGAHSIVFELVNMSEASLSPSVSQTLNFTIAELLPGGMETFDNCNATASYADGNFIGNNGITWNYSHSRDEGDYPINGKGLMLRRASDSKLESNPISGGISSFQLSMRKAFTGASDRQLELYINGELKGTSQVFGNGSGDDATVHTFIVENINVPGDFIIKIKNVGSTESNRQSVIDDISWTDYEETDPILTISAPANNTIVNTAQVNVNFSTENFVLNVDGKLEYKLNSGTPQYVVSSPFTITGLIEGNNNIDFQLVDMSENPLSPSVAISRTVIYEVPNTNPTLTITSPTQGATIYSQDLSIAFSLSNFVLGVDGKLSYKLDGAAKIMYLGTSPINLTGLSLGAHSIVFELVNMSEASLSPSVSQTLNFTIAELLPGGMETFDNCNATASYADGNFIGNNGITWNYSHSRDEGDYPINGKGLMLRRASDSKLESNPISGGISSFQLSMRKAFTGASDRQLELYINGELKGTSQVFGNGSGDDATVHTFIVENINVPGDFIIKIKNVGSTESNRQSVIDDISWTSYSGTEPYLAITSPANNSIIFSENVNIIFSVNNFDLGTQGKVKYILDTDPAEYTTTSPISLTDLEDGDHSISLELVDMSNNSLNPAVIRSINFTVNSAGPTITSIHDIQYTNSTTGDSPYKDQNVTTLGLVVGKAGDKFWLQDGQGAWNGLYIYYTSTPSPALGDSVYVSGKIVEYNGLTEMNPISNITNINSNNIIQTPSSVPTGNIGTEMYEGVLVKATGVCTNADAGYGMWEINDGSGVILLDDVMFAYTPILGHSYTVIGLVDYSFTEWKILPRFAADIVDNGASTEPMITISSPSNGSTVYSSNVDIAFNVSNFVLNTDGKVKCTYGDTETIVTQSPINITGLTNGNYTVNLELVNMSNAPLSPAVKASVNFTINLSGPSLTNIYDIQYTSNSNGNSPLNNQNVWIRGVISANFNGSPHGEGYYVQQGGGAWNSIYVLDLVNSPQVGDSVEIAGTVVEEYNLTAIKNVSSFTIVGVEGIVAPAVEVTTAQAATEPYESCLVKVTNAECTIVHNAFGEWYVNDGTGALLVKENGVSSIHEVLGYRYNITGVMYFSYSQFSLNYRNDNDIVLVSNIDNEFANNISIYPNPANSFININSQLGIETIKIFNSLGQIVIEKNLKSDNINLNIENLDYGVYYINIINNDKNAIFKFIKQ